LLSFFFLGEVLKEVQLIGGLVTIAGAVIIAAARYKPKIFARWLP
jgi:drug/metabolite transporter (DMT)-like permease